MNLWTSLEPASATVDPGDSTTVRLRLRNTGDVVDEYRFDVVGSLAPWALVEPRSLRLFPGTTGTVELTFSPPRTPDAAAGPHPYAVKVTPTEHPQATTVPEGNLTVTPFTEVRAELVPPTVKGRFRGRPRLAVDNLGNTKLTASVRGSDNGDQLSYDIRPGNVQIEPGRAAFLKATLKPRQIKWFGSKEDRPYTLAVRRSGATPLDVAGTYVQRSVLPRWLAAFMSLLLALVIAFVMVWLAHPPRVASTATEKLQEAPVTTLPQPPLPSPAPEAPKAASVPATTPPAAATTREADDDGGGAGSSGSEEKKTEPQERTAATAVRQKAAEEPGQPHICYRVYTREHGWSDAVCDGDTAGTGGAGEQITSVNTAVSKSNGTAGGANVHNPTGTDQYYPHAWTNAVDGDDNYVGSTKEDAPYIRGFNIQVDGGKGVVCQTAYVHDDGWRAQACDEGLNDYYDFAYAGAQENDVWIEAVRLTV
ncbi:hydrolase [Streptomyces sp. NPDC008125]|uniref:COG1470 family protein n=1 Tax=Streptomyces sp. NPDC008125 TaxID=3364811 RepID=UPI0036EB9DD6